MKLEDKQRSLDDFKWKLSNDVGHDTCGEFDYCKYCNKGQDYPCAKAFNEFETQRKKNK